MDKSIADIRKEYKLHSLDEKDIGLDPIIQFGKWWVEALNSGIEEANAMTLATADKQGRPSARIVLLKGYGESGFNFYTNYESRKGIELEANPQACLVFFWKELERQVRVTGSVSRVSESESDDYFNSRPIDSRLGALSSPQSRVIDSRKFLEDRFEDFKHKFGSTGIPRPSNWGGYSLAPTEIEFWQGRPGRMHDRVRYKQAGHSWIIERLAP